MGVHLWTTVAAPEKENDAGSGNDKPMNRRAPDLSIQIRWRLGHLVYSRSLQQ